MTRRPTQWIVQGKWTEHDNKAVKREGWKLAYHPSGTVGITTLLSDKRTFGEWTNSMAEAWVRKRADEGSVIHGSCRGSSSPFASATAVHRALGGGVALAHAQADVEDGASVAVVSDSLSVHLHLKGLIDPTAESAKLAARAMKVDDELQKLRKRVSAAGYEDKVPADVRAANADAIAAGEKQLAVLAALRAQYESWTK